MQIEFNLQSDSRTAPPIVYDWFAKPKWLPEILTPAAEYKLYRDTGVKPESYSQAIKDARYNFDTSKKKLDNITAYYKEEHGDILLQWIWFYTSFGARRISYNFNGQVNSIQFYNKDYVLANKFGPHEIRYRNNKRYSEEFDIEINSPAIINYYEDGYSPSYISYKDYMENFHRTDGPAVIYFNRRGEKTDEKYMYNNHQLSKENWQAMVDTDNENEE